MARPTGVIPVSQRLDENLAYLGSKLGRDTSFDVQVRRFKAGGRPAALVWIDGFIKSRETQAVLGLLQRANGEEIAPPFLRNLLAGHLNWFELNTSRNLNEVLDQILAGPAALLLEGEREAILLDLREWPARGVQEPDTERVTRGAREGFSETLLYNTILIRRRLRDPALRFEMFQVGERSKTDVVLCYIQDIANPRLVDEVRRRLQKVKTDAIPMGTKNLEEFLFPVGLNPLPKVRFTERPDVVAAHLLEGHFAVLADTVPVAMIGPTNVWSLAQHAEEFFQTPAVGTYLRWVRLLGALVALVLSPLWLGMAAHRGELPDWLAFIGPREAARVPLSLQVISLEIGLDLIRMALIHTPNALATSLGIVGAVLLGEIAVEVGLFNAEPILYVAIVALAAFAVPNLEFQNALRLFRLVLLGFVVAGGLPGFFVGLFFVVLIFARTTSLGLPYLWPLLPWDGRAMLHVLVRLPLPLVRLRPKFAHPLDRDTGQGPLTAREPHLSPRP